MIRTIKNEPVTVLIVTAATIAILIAALHVIMPTCPKGFLWVDTPQGKGCVSEYVWKDM